MKRRSILGCLLAGALVASPAYAQDAEPIEAGPQGEQSAPAQPSASEPDPLDPSKVQTWYVMIALYEPETAEACARRVDKVSTKEPIAIEGPDRININHINAVVGEWINYISGASPTAYRMINGPEGHKTDVYFRRTEYEAREAFRRDGHLTRNRRCLRSVLITHPTQRFRFSRPRDFADSDFGVPYQPPPVMAGNVRDLAKIPGVPEGQ